MRERECYFLILHTKLVSSPAAGLLCYSPILVGLALALWHPYPEGMNKNGNETQHSTFLSHRDYTSSVWVVLLLLFQAFFMTTFVMEASCRRGIMA